MRSSRREAARGLLLLLIAFAVYAPIFDGGFLHDDDELVASNPVIQRGGRGFGPESWAGLRELWFPGPGSRNVFTLPGMFVPLDATARWLEWRMFGSDEQSAAPEARGIGAPGYHVVNVLLHALCALILWRVLVQLAIPGAWFTALAWAVHPLCVESVAWIAEQRNTLAMACSLASCAAWLRWRETRERRAWVASLIAFLFALLAKPAVVPLPFVLLLLGWWRRRPIGGEMRAALPFFGLSLAAGLLGAALQSSYAIGSAPLPIGSPVERIVHASFAIGFYAWAAIFPFHLMAIYPRWHETLPWTVQIAPALAAAILLAASWRARERWGRHVILCVGGFAAMLAPALGFVPMSYMRHTLIADHFAYFALPFPLALMVGSTGAWCLAGGALRRPIIRTAAAAVAMLLSWQTASYAAAFRDKRTLWTRTLEHNPDAWLAHDQLGSLLAAEGRYAEAVPYYERAVALAPENAELHNNLAVAFDHLGQRERALAHIRRAAELKPDDYFIRLNGATALLGAGRPREALPYFEAALQLATQRGTAVDPGIRIAYGAALLQAGRPRDAIDQLDRVLARNPDRPAARRLLAEARRQLAAERSPAAAP
jgi:protein O-mannosyl-transferase